MNVTVRLFIALFVAGLTAAAWNHYALPTLTVRFAEYTYIPVMIVAGFIAYLASGGE